MGRHTKEPLPKKLQYYAHTLIKGNVEWGKEANGTNQGDYHDYFEIEVSPALPLISSRLVFFGHSGNGAFITNATSCPGDNTTTLTLTDTEKHTVDEAVHHADRADRLQPRPLRTKLRSRARHDSLRRARRLHGRSRNSRTTPRRNRQLAGENGDVHAARRHDAEPVGRRRADSVHAGTGANPQRRSPASTCPAAPSSARSNLERPDPARPARSRATSTSAAPESGPITGPPYTIYLDAESATLRRLGAPEGRSDPQRSHRSASRRCSTKPPNSRSRRRSLHFKEGALAPSPTRSPAAPRSTETSLTPFANPLTPSDAQRRVHGRQQRSAGACARPAAVHADAEQLDQQAPTRARTRTSRSTSHAPDGHQYLSKVKTTLPAGPRRRDPDGDAVPRSAGDARTPARPTSQIGTATVIAGSGSDAVHVQRARST